jgi:signal-transduction protein with cAMP-binding, CBS, and nucleotidyltransferase domain
MSSISEVMTPEPICFDKDAPVRDAARAMRDENIGDVIITAGERVYGILTDRDIVVRCVAEESDVDSCTCGKVCSADIVTVAPSASLEEAVHLMRERAVRRLIVTEGERPVGIVSLGDLAQERDPRSVLGDISGAAPNI